MEQQTTTAVAVMSYKDMREMATDVVKSGMFAMKTTEQALTLMSICQAEGLHPMQALKRYHIINGGRPSMRADAMLADFQRLGGRVKWVVRTDSECTAVFTHEQGGDVEVRWTIEMAQKAQLTRNQTWQQYPRQMLTARVISEGIRTCLPGVVAGIYTPEEEADMRASSEVQKPIPPVASETRATKPATKVTHAPQPAPVVEAEYTPVEQPAPTQATETPADPTPTAPEAPVEAGPDIAAAIADLPDVAPPTMKGQLAVAKAVYKILPAEEVAALRADLNGCASESSRQAVLQKVIDGLKKGGF